MPKIPVYFMPGLAASPAIFENIKLPEEDFECHFLEWIIPIKNENIKEYALRISKNIKNENPVLIGVSFGGILVQEIAEIIPTYKTIIISSIKTNREMPKRMRFAKKTKIYKLLPTRFVSNIELLAKFALGENIVASRIKLYEKFLSVRDKKYLKWAIENVILWSRTITNDQIIHIHGENDNVFPLKNIQNAIVVPGGTHVMILTKYKWLNENLPKIITKT